ncbi:NitT/TauT family transport system ATP-binding protein [Endobacter medicaginis]|uniref:ABC transporter ATP-binding protein n=1 Tax=Endobacter medicaginis TaxID=1181271 RepID=A0A850NST9_9PROT|nr:ABC transporter ATP-binding protein [Endobacter medicaginis]MBB3173433.1 NitT/TauT family transport system ATP-binding protein [Endobacter medicaginis]MCX5475532.1 ABC transporter ATP-binding protein [Endobacter medicaginis]NVN31310.1 ABC transporter ATP-binding protein [Endobacter medicaginis]
MSLPIVEMLAAEKTFPGGVQALAPVELSVRPGELIGLIGPSGCGKSTLLKLIANLHTPSAGEMRWWGEDFTRVGEAGRRLSFVFQDPTLMPWADVATNVRLPLDLDGIPRDEARARVAPALAQVGLSHAADRTPAQLSGGMRMRVSIARALVTRPDLLLMDEPFAALDEFTRNRLDEDMALLCAQGGLTTIFVTHSLTEAAFLSTRVLVMAPDPGRIHAEYAIDPTIVRDEAFRLSAEFAAICRDLSALLNEVSHARAAADA